MSPFYTKIREQIGTSLLMMPGVAGLIRNNMGELLLQQKSDDSWSLPAGAIEPSETPEQAIKREVLEETGYITKKVRLCGVFGGESFRHVYPNGDQVEYLVALYECEEVEQVQKPSDDETKRLEFFSQNNFPKLSLPYPMATLFPNEMENKAD